MLLTTDAITMAKECHRHGTVMPLAWHSSANVVAEGLHSYLY